MGDGKLRHASAIFCWKLCEVSCLWRLVLRVPINCAMALGPTPPASSLRQNDHSVSRCP